MKTTLNLSVWLCAALFFTFTAGAHAQAKLYAIVANMQVPSGMDDEYIKMENELFKPVHQKRMAKGELANWALFKVIETDEVNPTYNYVTVNYYTSMEAMQKAKSLDMAYWTTVFQEVHPGVEINSVVALADQSSHHGDFAGNFSVWTGAVDQKVRWR